MRDITDVMPSNKMRKMNFKFGFGSTIMNNMHKRVI